MNLCERIPEDIVYIMPFFEELKSKLERITGEKVLVIEMSDAMLKRCYQAPDFNEDKLNLPVLLNNAVPLNKIIMRT